MVKATESCWYAFTGVTARNVVVDVCLWECLPGMASKECKPITGPGPPQSPQRGSRTNSLHRRSEGSPSPVPHEDEYLLAFRLSAEKHKFATFKRNSAIESCTGTIFCPHPHPIPVVLSPSPPMPTAFKISSPSPRKLSPSPPRSRDYCPCPHPITDALAIVTISATWQFQISITNTNTYRQKQYETQHQ